MHFTKVKNEHQFELNIEIISVTHLQIVLSIAVVGFAAGNPLINRNLDLHVSCSFVAMANRYSQLKTLSPRT